MKKITLIHTVKSVANSFDTQIREEINKPLSITNILDEFLVTNAKAKGFFPPENKRKLFLDLLSASEEKSDVIVVTCSSLTPYVIELRSSFETPIITIDEEMCRIAALAGDKIAVLATAPTTINPTVSRIEAEAKKLDKNVTVSAYLDEKAIELLSNGDVKGHDARVAELACKNTADADVIVLAQASMASASKLVGERTGKRVITSPHSCIPEIKKTLSF